MTYSGSNHFFTVVEFLSHCISAPVKQLRNCEVAPAVKMLCKSGIDWPQEGNNHLDLSRTCGSCSHFVEKSQ